MSGYARRLTDSKVRLYQAQLGLFLRIRDLDTAVTNTELSALEQSLLYHAKAIHQALVQEIATEYQVQPTPLSFNQLNEQLVSKEHSCAQVEKLAELEVLPTAFLSLMLQQYQIGLTGDAGGLSTAVNSSDSQLISSTKLNILKIVMNCCEALIIEIEQFRELMQEW